MRGSVIVLLQSITKVVNNVRTSSLFWWEPLLCASKRTAHAQCNCLRPALCFDDELSSTFSRVAAGSLSCNQSSSEYADLMLRLGLIEC